jgi:hypothetical protein
LAAVGKRHIGLIDAIDDRLHLLKIHLPFHESDHVLNFAYNALCDGVCLQDIVHLGKTAEMPGQLVVAPLLRRYSGFLKLRLKVTAGFLFAMSSDQLVLNELQLVAGPEVVCRHMDREAPFEAVTLTALPYPVAGRSLNGNLG